MVLACVRVWPGCRDDAVPDDGPAPLPDRAPQALGLLVCDPALCAACGRCAITCSSLRYGETGAEVALVGPDRSYCAVQLGGWAWVAQGCHMCVERRRDGQVDEPACVAACPRGAARIAATGHALYGDSLVRYIDAETCIGCGFCLRACPFQHPRVAAGKARKCDLCVGTYGSPPCVDACPSSALRFASPWSEALLRPFPWAPQAPAGGGGAELDGGVDDDVGEAPSDAGTPGGGEGSDGASGGGSGDDEAAPSGEEC